jgi:hypothetical protein
VFEKTNFKAKYAVTSVPDFQHMMIGALHAIIMDHAGRHGISPHEAKDFFKKLQLEAFQKPQELLSEVCVECSSDVMCCAMTFAKVPYACQRMWTSPLQLGGREFCSLLNEAIRLDVPSIMDDVGLICRGLNSLCVERLRPEKKSTVWPADNLLYRGSSLPDDKRSFFKVGLTYRCPMYLATSSDKKVSLRTFCRRAQESGLPPVLWTLHIDPEVIHSHTIHISCLSHALFPAFLFPYSFIVFTPITSSVPIAPESLSTSLSPTPSLQ